MPTPQQAFIRRVDRHAEVPKTTQNTPAKARRAELTRPKSLDLGASPDPYAPSSIKDKVLKWQKLAAEEALSPNQGHDPKDYFEEIPTPNRKKRRSRDKGIGGSFPAEAPIEPILEERPLKSKTLPRPIAKEDQQVKKSSPPKKRVVSDEHWRKKDSPAQNQAKAGGVASNPKHATREQEKPSKTLERATPAKYDAWVRPRASAVRPAKGVDPKAKNDTTNASPRKALNGIQPPDSESLRPEVPRSDDGFEPNGKAGVTVLKPRAQATKNTSSPRAIRNTSGRSPKQSHDDFKPAKSRLPSDQTAPSTEHTPLNRIEAWLGSTQDPFTEVKPRRGNRKASAAFDDLSETDSRPVLSRWSMPGEVEEKKFMARNRGVDKDEGSFNNHTDAVHTSPKRNHESGTALSLTSNSSPGSPSLKRSGARRSHNVSHTSQPFMGEGDQHSLVLANVRHTEEYEQRPSDNVIQNAHKKAERPKPKRKTTSDADLLSVLSLPHDGRKSLPSACSVRDSRRRISSGTFDDLMHELKSDEMKYQVHLRTLLDGVIPVLLRNALSKSKDATTQYAAGGATPIVGMGVAIERLKSAHSRIPFDTPENLIEWAMTTQRIYADYLKSWRMGFEDVVVNLAPAENAKRSVSMQASVPGLEKTDVMKSGNNASYKDEEKADVAFLLKRPLVRLKYLAKTLKGLDNAHSSVSSSPVLRMYQDLQSEAHQRQVEEKERLEDQAAATIDVTRARDPQNLAVKTGASIDPSLYVRARDFFDLKLLHSTGQRIDCRAQLIFRRKELGGTAYHGGDLIICELDGTQRWALFPPIHLGQISARSGDSVDELVMMIRGTSLNGTGWYEILSLFSLDEDPGNNCMEWLEMLGTHPVPHRAQLNEGYHLGHMPSDDRQSQIPRMRDDGRGTKSGANDIDIPLGEPASVLSQDWQYKAGRADMIPPISPIESSVVDFADTDRRPRPLSMSPKSSTSQAEPQTPPHIRPSHKRPRESEHPSTLHRFGKALGLGMSGSSSMSHPVPDHYSTIGGSLPTTPVNRTKERPRRPLSDYRSASSSTTSRSNQGYSVWLPSEERESDANQLHLHGPRESVRDLGKTSHVDKPLHDIDGGRLAVSRTRGSPSREEDATYTDYESKYRFAKDLRARQDFSEGAKQPTDHNLRDHVQQQHVPQTPPDRKSEHLSQTPTPKFSPPRSGPNSARRSSSPLKYEYAPSSSSDRSSINANVLLDEDEKSISSESSAEDIVPPLPPISALRIGSHRAPPSSAYSPRNAGVLMHSKLSSPMSGQTSLDSGGRSMKMIASIYSWSDKGSWDLVHPDECSIIVTPGLIEAFEMSAAHSLPSNYRNGADDSRSPEKDSSITKPLVGLELTPLVPLRRGTAIDISIRSPPTEISQLKPGNNIMFRSRNNQECDTLYGMINQARINNPTYIALQNARGPFGQSNWAGYMEQQAASRGGGASWWRLGGTKKSSYRAKSTRRASSVAQQTEASIASMSSAISALLRFGAGNKVFNVAKSTVSARGGIGIGSKSSTTFSSSSGGNKSGGSLDKSGSSTPTTPIDPSKGAPTSITKVRVRLYVREGTRWRDMGAARLSIMHPPRPPGQPPEMTKDGKLKQEKRVIVSGDTRGETLLDVTLGEGCFERVALKGIAISVWEQRAEIGKSGGVMTTSMKVYMIQMTSEAEAAYAFSLVGRLRY